MAKMQARVNTEERDDGLREKMIAVNRVSKTVKGGRVLGFAALTVHLLPSGIVTELRP